MEGYPSYEDEICGTIVCKNEPLECQDPNIFEVNDCTYPSIQLYCPVLCGKCPKNPNTTKISTIATTKATTCPIHYCQNGGTQNPTTCDCECNLKI